MYTQTGQTCVALFARGRNVIGREEIILQPIIEQLKDRTDIRGYSAPVHLQFKILDALNNLTGKKIKVLDRKVNRMKYEYLTGTVKIFAFDSLDIETNSYGNSIFISKGALDTLTSGELRAVIHNEFAQIKTNISNMRLLHDGNIVLGRISAVMVLIIAPIVLGIGMAGTLIASSSSLGIMSSSGTTIASSIGSGFTKVFIIGVLSVICIIRLIVDIASKKWGNTIYMFYERKIFIKADRLTHKSGFSVDMLKYLEKLYVFKLGNKEVGKLFVELRPLVAYRINYFDNVLGKNRELSEENYAWSSNYMERVQTVNNNKNT
ncbi:hypothetical protein [Clostridium lacusfryxellense]|uniref:hypothetical protein n=1 Tax=Clostridium lacusfryxellense TaxID=205328 RepID=UPI001C0DFDC0|nr:hypothetical protein [Clostridium lacusfryxellense]MBU3114740.1 hypothetical protein [Clostridium lacusfryxellense]